MAISRDTVETQAELARARLWLEQYQKRLNQGDASLDAIKLAPKVSDVVANIKHWLSKNGVAVSDDAIDEIGFEARSVNSIRPSSSPRAIATTSDALSGQSRSPTASSTHPRVQMGIGLSTYFSKEELRNLTFDLGINFENLRGETLSDIARELVAYCERHQQIDALLAASRKARPKVTWPDHPWNIEPEHFEARTPLINRKPPVLDETFGAWSPWLVALASADQHVGTTIVRFQERFKTTREQLIRLRACKNVHHYLHDLQLQCYGLLITELEQSSAIRTSGSQSRLEVYLHLLDPIIASLEAQYQSSPFVALDRACFDNLHHARAEIKLAIEQEPEDHLRSAVNSLRVVLVLYPSTLNGQLLTIVQQLQINALIEALMEIAKTIQSVETGRIQAMERDIGRLRSFEHELTTVIDEHNQWQHVDNQLPVIADLLAVGVESCKSVWDIVRANAIRLYHHRADRWANDLLNYEERFSVAIAQQDTQQAQRAFASYRSGAMQRFYGVDQKLLDQCNQLNRLDGPLSFLVGVIV